VQPLEGGGTFFIVCEENEVTFKALDRHGRPLSWAWNIIGGDQLESIIREVKQTSVLFHHAGVDYQLKLGSQAGSCQRLGGGVVRLVPNDAGKLVFKFDTASVAAEVRKRKISQS
jgi:hypothetical protein